MATHTGALDERFAYVLTYAINPLVLPVFLIGLVLGHLGAPAGEVWRAVGIGLVFFGLVPLGYVAYLLRRGRVASLEIRDRRRRTRPFLVGLISYGAGAALLLQAPVSNGAEELAALLGCFLANLFLLLVVNLRWKISVHAAALASFFSVLLFVAQAPGSAGTLLPLRPAALLGLLVLLPLLMWARVRVGAHTRGQVLSGALFGLVLPYAELYGLVILDFGFWILD